MIGGLIGLVIIFLAIAYWSSPGGDVKDQQYRDYIRREARKADRR